MHELENLHCDIVLHEPTIGTSPTGKPLHGPAVQRPARVIDRQRVILDAKTGATAISKRTIYIGEPNVVILTTDRFTVLGEPLDSMGRILAVEAAPDDLGDRWTKVSF